MKIRLGRRTALASLAAAGLPRLALAQPGLLRIGALTDPPVDPHWLYLSSNMAYSQHIFDALAYKNDRSQAGPGLAESWRVLDEHSWEFTLREGVRFHDGTPLSADDVAFTIERVPSLAGNPGPYTPNLRGMTKVEVLDARRLRCTTAGPVPTLPANLGSIYVVSRRAAAGAQPADFRAGRAAIGTGPYRFVSYAQAEKLELVRNDAYFGAKPAFERAVFRVIPNAAARAAALLAGEVDLIDFVPPELLAALARNPAIEVLSRPSDRVIFLVPDTDRAVSPFVRAHDGAELATNPLRDLRVRRAMSLAINREALCRQTMDGLAEATGQLVPRGYLGHSDDLAPDPYDPERARALLAEAGYPQGFRMTLHGPSGRYVNDARVAQALGAMLTRIGIETQVETMPVSTFFSRSNARRREFSLHLLGWGSSGDGEAGYGLSTLIHTKTPDGRIGGTNTGGYSNQAVDAAIAEALRAFERDAREAALQRAMRLAMDDVAVIPLYVQYTTVAVRRGIAYAVRDDEKTLAMNARPA
ncbi:MAG: ABC transporter substrate-binding protein [Acetobacteraceae bacterium]|nr:ABC transporter substrate-binding protein [Acetobacteraceae bacterium]